MGRAPAPAGNTVRQERSNMNDNTDNTYPSRPLPPPLPPGRGSAPVRQAPARKIFSGFEDDFQPMGKEPTWLNVVDCLLKHPARVTHALAKDKSTRTTWILLGVLTLCMLAYGIIMGSFSGGEQWWVVPVKMVVGTFLSALICLPSLYIFASVSGSDRSFAEIAGLLLQCLALSAVLLVGLAPVAWIFSQSTNAAAFMGFLHLLFWGAGIAFGLLLMQTAFGYLNDNRTSILKLWNLIFVLVVLQMCTALRPLVGEFEGYGLQGKKFFVAHWYDSIETASDEPRSGTRGFRP
jgi:hypothetical protein